MHKCIIDLVECIQQLKNTLSTEMSNQMTDWRMSEKVNCFDGRAWKEKNICMQNFP